MSRYEAACRARYAALCAETGRPPAPAPDEATLARVAALLGTTPGELRRRRRDRAIVRPRQEAMWLLDRARLPRAAIGRLIGRNHATVLYGIAQVETRIAADAAARARLEALAGQGGLR